MINLLNLSYSELELYFVAELNEPKFRAKQVWQWIWQKMVLDFDDMSNVSKTLRVKLKAVACITWPKIIKVEKSSDGTIKFLLELEDKASVETVLIPAKQMNGRTRMTQCLSSQVGCAMACTFCSTGNMGFERNMSAGEILGQVLVARDYLGDARPEHPIIKNLVFMGMGEPLLNFTELMKSLLTLNDDFGLNFSPRRITVSTCGIKKGLLELGESGLAFLAISLHAPNQALREKIMPKAAKWPLDDLIRTLEKYPLKTRERITFEYLLLGGLNDSIEHANALASLVKKIKGKLNLISYNAVQGSYYSSPSPEAILAFEKILWAKKITAVLRKSKGQDINAACGQLKSLQIRS